jgi:DNA-binding HxlR family transcriptional regulator
VATRVRKTTTVVRVRTVERQAPAPGCCPHYHEAIELIGKRWTGAIVRVLLVSGPLRFSQIAHAVPALSDRLLSERIKELEARGLVARDARGPAPTYALTRMGAELEPALVHVEAWAQRWSVAARGD